MRCSSRIQIFSLPFLSPPSPLPTPSPPSSPPISPPVRRRSPSPSPEQTIQDQSNSESPQLKAQDLESKIQNANNGKSGGEVWGLPEREIREQVRQIVAGEIINVFEEVVVPEGRKVIKMMALEMTEAGRSMLQDTHKRISDLEQKLLEKSQNEKA